MKFENIFNNGFSKSAHSLSRCNRLGNLPRRILLEVLNKQNTDISNSKKNIGEVEDHSIVKINRLKLESFLDDSSYKVIYNSVQKLMDNGFLEEFNTKGIDYIFKVCEDIEDNPLVLLSEVDQLFFNKYLSEFTSYTKVEKVKKVVKEFRYKDKDGKSKDESFIQRLKLSTSKEDTEEILNDYIKTLTDAVTLVNIKVNRKERFSFKSETKEKKEYFQPHYKNKSLCTVPQSEEKYDYDQGLTPEELLEHFKNLG